MTQIAPHGKAGLCNKLISTADKERLFGSLLNKMPRITLSEVTIADLLCIATGLFSPLTGFMKEADYLSVIDNMRLTDGTLWPIPITLSITREQLSIVKQVEYLLLTDHNDRPLAVQRVEDIYEVNLEHEAQSVFKTTSSDHPAVARMGANLYVGGEIWLFERPDFGVKSAYCYDPADMRALFAERGWESIVAFQTRNPVHRAHEYIQKVALETHDALLLSPLVGATKADDIPTDVRMASYETLLANYYPMDRVLLGAFPAAMRYAGPKEAILHAICRQNYGCTHFIVGRDHAGVGNFYGPYDAQNLLKGLAKDDLLIQPLFFEHTFFCKKCAGMASYKTCPHAAEDHLIFSGTKVRELLRTGQTLPPEFSRPEVVQVLLNHTND